ncbi:hypothetical protein [Sphingobacterium mizutaii]|uniref:hypothetical protein n=1 Tax=Sphingobacterium mizutaii TaxID=1010 RepID=UPI0028A0CFDE|nr:hypothetical protein [Sphingobacterium mizutaii]
MNKEFRTIQVAEGYQVQMKHFWVWRTVKNPDGSKLIFDREIEALLFTLEYDVVIEVDWTTVFTYLVGAIALLTFWIYVYYNFIK